MVCDYYFTDHVVEDHIIDRFASDYSINTADLASLSNVESSKDESIYIPDTDSREFPQAPADTGSTQQVSVSKLADLG